MSGLEHSYRRLLRLYPRRYRAGREEELLAVLLDASPAGAERATARDAADLALGALRAHGAGTLQAARRRPAAAAGWSALAGGLALVLLPGAPTPAPRAPEGMPSRLPTYSSLTGDASSSPPGPVVALYQQGSNADEVDTRQAVAVGASGAYRQVALDGLLSPDGTRIARGEAYGEGSEHPVVTVQDLTTGDVARHPVVGGRYAGPMAWAPDGRQLAVATQQVPEPDYHVPGQTGEVLVLDLETGVNRAVRGTPGHPMGGTFAPDGTRIAVQDLSGEVVVVDLRSGAARSVGHVDHFIGGSSSWSPDGALIATAHPLDFDAGARQCHPFVAVDGGPVPECFDAGADDDRSFVGWTGSRSVAVLEAGYGTRDPAILLEVDLVTGDERRLTTIPTRNGDRQVAGMQVPQVLLSSVVVVDPPTTHRVRWPLVLRLSAAAGSAVLITAIVAVTVRGLRRRASTRGGGTARATAGPPA